MWGMASESQKKELKCKVPLQSIGTAYVPYWQLLQKGKKIVYTGVVYITTGRQREDPKGLSQRKTMDGGGPKGPLVSLSSLRMIEVFFLPSGTRSRISEICFPFGRS